MGLVLFLLCCLLAARLRVRPGSTAGQRRQRLVLVWRGAAALLVKGPTGWMLGGREALWLSSAVLGGGLLGSEKVAVVILFC